MQIIKNIPIGVSYWRDEQKYVRQHPKKETDGIAEKAVDGCLT